MTRTLPSTHTRHRVLTTLVVAIVAGLLLLPAAAGRVTAQDNAGGDSSVQQVMLPGRFQLNNFSFERQSWNNCGPATITNALSYFGYDDDQTRAASYLKPSSEDKNVSPWQMVSYVNTQVPELADVLAIQRYGGDGALIRQLLANGFPVIIEQGYDPEARFGWMGHYLLVIGYDENEREWITYDSYLGPNTTYDYDYLDRHWQQFNYTYITLYRLENQERLQRVLGDNWNTKSNLNQTFERAMAEIEQNGNNAYAWNNLGSVYTMNQQYDYAVIAFDKARQLGLPWRINWYQFDMYEAYNAVGRYNDVQTLTTRALNDGGGHQVEESYYYAGLAQMGLGNTSAAVENFRRAVEFNPNFRPAQQKLDALGA